MILAGYTCGNWTTTQVGVCDVLVVKLDLNGTVMWTWQVAAALCWSKQLSAMTNTIYKYAPPPSANKKIAVQAMESLNQTISFLDACGENINLMITSQQTWPSVSPVEDTIHTLLLYGGILFVS